MDSDDSYRQLVAAILYRALLDWNLRWDWDVERMMAEWDAEVMRRQCKALARGTWREYKQRNYHLKLTDWPPMRVASRCGFDCPGSELRAFFESDWCRYLLSAVDIEPHLFFSELGRRAGAEV